MNYYPNYNQFYGQAFQQQMPRMQQIEQNYPQYQQQTMLQGKSVDSVDVVKAIDIPLDGSVSYFPLADGSAILTKQLQTDGTSKTITYRPVEEKQKEVKYITMEQFKEELDKLNTADIKNMKRQLEDLVEEIEDINKKLKKKGE